MKSKILKSIKSSEVQVEIHKITNTLCIFKATITSVLNGVEIEESSEGVSLIKNVLLAHKECRLPTFNKYYVKCSSAFLELIRQYGHPATLSTNYSFDGVKALPLMNAEMDNNQVSFEDAKNPNILNELLYVNYAAHSVIKLNSNTLCNVARFAENIKIEESKYKNFKDVVEFLISEKRINIMDKNKGKIPSHYDSHLRYISGKVVFSDTEFYAIIDTMKDVKDHIDDYRFALAINELNSLNINDNLKTKEEISEDDRIQYDS
jgi:hypothetical protein